MTRVASLILPRLATDRIAPRPNSSPALQGRGTAKRWRGASEASPGAPLVTTHRSGNRIAIAAASREAGALGIAPGMALAFARARVPGLEVHDADPAGDAALLGRLAGFAARRWTHRAALAGENALWLDISGVAHLFGGEAAMCRHVLGFCARAGFEARIAVAGTPGAAFALASFGGTPLLICPTGGEAAALAPLPLAALRIPAEAGEAARLLGIETIGELAAMPRGPLGRRLGKAVLLRLDQALGHAGEALDPVIPADPPAASLRFAEPIASAEAIGEAMRILVARLADMLAKAGLGGRRFVLICLRVDNDRQCIELRTARATRDGGHLLRLATDRIEEIEPGFGVDAMRLVATRCEPLAPQPVESALGGGGEGPDLALLIDRLVGRLGHRRLYRTSAVESDVPERSCRRIGPLAAPLSWPPWPRPVRLLSPPERLANVVALLPDQPPRRFTWRGRRHVVARADGPERIHGEWWRRRSEDHRVRDYFQVEDQKGARFWLYRRGDGEDPRTGDLAWYLHGLFG